MTLPVRRSESDRRGLLEWEPFAEFERLNRQMTDLFDRFWRQSDGFVPAADIEETDDAYLVEIELPGVKREDIDVELVGRRLSVTGERKERERTGILRRRTRVTGRFQYEVAFPTEVEDGEVSAAYADGLLTVKVPKAASERARKVEVR